MLVARGPWANETPRTVAFTHVVRAPLMAKERPAAAKAVSKTRVTDCKGGQIRGRGYVSGATWRGEVRVPRGVCGRPWAVKDLCLMLEQA